MKAPAPHKVPEYRVVVPSRGRVANMERIQTLLPFATIVVAEAEKDAYLREVDAARLVTHPGVPGGVSGLPNVYNWLIENFKEETLVEIDDDLQNVFSWAGDGAKTIWLRLRNPDDILQIIENGVQLAADLGVSTFSWSKAQNTAHSKVDHKPITPTGLVANAFGVRGQARHRKYDPEMIGRASVDWTLRTLLQDRCVLIDKRAFFDCGKIFGGSGGNAGIVTAAKFEKATKNLAEKWGRHISFGANPGSSRGGKRLDKNGKVLNSNEGDRQVSIRVSRRNNAAAL